MFRAVLRVAPARPELKFLCPCLGPSGEVGECKIFRRYSSGGVGRDASRLGRTSTRFEAKASADFIVLYVVLRNIQREVLESYHRDNWLVAAKRS